MEFVFLDQDIRKNFINGEDIVAPLRQRGNVRYFDDVPCSQDILFERAKNADAIIFSINQLGNPLIEKLSRLKLVQFMGIGYRSYVDVNYCEKKGIKVLGVPEYGSNAVAEFAIALMLSAIRGITIGDRRMKKEIWDMENLLGMEMALSTVGIVGTGAIGRMVAQKASLLGARVLANDIIENKDLIDRYGVQYDNIRTVMSESDIVSVHLNYTPSTEKLISRELFSMMKPSAVFINTARAQVVDYTALQEMLQANRLRAAAIDVHYGEPPASWTLSCMDNVIATPHIGYFTETANTNLLKKSVESVLNNFPLADYTRG